MAQVFLTCAANSKSHPVTRLPLPFLYFCKQCFDLIIPVSRHGIITLLISPQKSRFGFSGFLSSFWKNCSGLSIAFKEPVKASSPRAVFLMNFRLLRFFMVINYFMMMSLSIFSEIAFEVKISRLVLSFLFKLL